MSEHTPTPWSKDIRCRIGPRFETDDQSDGMLDDIMEVYGENREANAAFIVKAANNHDALVKALERIAGNEFLCPAAADFAKAVLGDVGGVRHD